MKNGAATKCGEELLCFLGVVMIFGQDFLDANMIYIFCWTLIDDCVSVCSLSALFSSSCMTLGLTTLQTPTVQIQILKGDSCNDDLGRRY